MAESGFPSEDMSPTRAPSVQELAEHQILSAPVIVAPGLEDMEKEEGDSWDPTLLGWLDVRDILAAFVQRECAGACCYRRCRPLLQCAHHASQGTSHILCLAMGQGTCGKDPLPSCLCTGGSRAVGQSPMPHFGQSHPCTARCRAAHQAPLLVPSDVEQTTPELPTRMLQLMSLLEREGRTFAQKTLVTLASCNDRGLVFQANCSTTLLGAIRCAPSF